jgi:hypothetical protein
LAPGLARKVKKVQIVTCQKSTKPTIACASLQSKALTCVNGYTLPRQIMETRTEAPEVVGSLATLSGFFTENAPAARRRLRSTVENQGVCINEEFLEAAQSVLKVRRASPRPLANRQWQLWLTSAAKGRLACLGAAQPTRSHLVTQHPAC